MDTRKVTLVATIAVIALIAVGIGYAYTASTVNSGNDANSEYINLVQRNVGDNTVGAYQFTSSTDKSIYWDTVDYKVGSQAKTDYSLSSQSVDVATVFGAAPFKCAVQIGKPFILDASATSSTVAAADLKVQVQGSGFEAYLVSSTPKAYTILEVNDQTAAHKQYVMFGTATSGVNAVTVYNSSWVANTGDDVNKITLYKGTSPDQYAAATITAYYVTVDKAISVDHAVAQNADFPTGPSTTPLDNAKVTFTVTQNSWNGSAESGQNVTGVEITDLPQSGKVTVVKGSTATFTVSVTGGANNTNKGFVAYSNDTSVITTVAIDPSTNVVTITAANDAAGKTTTITVITNEGGFTVDVPVEVTNSA